MYGFSTLALLASIASTVVAQQNETAEYRLKSEVKPNQTNQVLYEDLYITSYHTGYVLDSCLCPRLKLIMTSAGLGDATFVRNVSLAATGFLNVTNTSTAEAPNYVQEFDLGTEFPWYESCFRWFMTAS